MGEQLGSQQCGQSSLKWELSLLRPGDQGEKETQQKLVNSELSSCSNTELSCFHVASSYKICWIATKSPAGHKSGPRASSCQAYSQGSEYLLQNNYLLYKG